MTCLELCNGLLRLRQMFLVSLCVLAVVGAVQTYSEEAAGQLPAAHLSDCFWRLSDPLARQFSLLYQEKFFLQGKVECVFKIYLLDLAVV